MTSRFGSTEEAGELAEVSLVWGLMDRVERILEWVGQLWEVSGPDDFPAELYQIVWNFAVKGNIEMER